MNYLVVVAHPDDEVLGAGATIHKLISEGHNVAVAIMVSQAAARKALSSTLSDDEAKALSIIGSCIEDWNAEVIITHHPSDTNNDHIQTSYAVQAACRLFQRRDNLTALKEVLYMEVLSSTEWSLDTSANRFTPNYFVEVGKEGVELKLKALSEYKGVMRPYPHPRSNEALEGLAAYRGVQAGCNYAEAFECAFRRI